MDLVTALASLDAYVRDMYSQSRQHKEGRIQSDRALQRNHDALAVVAAVVHKVIADAHVPEDMVERTILGEPIETTTDGQ